MCGSPVCISSSAPPSWTGELEMLEVLRPPGPLSTFLRGFRVFSDRGCFLLVLFCSTHKSPQFFQCGSSGRGPEPGPDYQLMTAFQRVTLYQVRRLRRDRPPRCAVFDLWALGRRGRRRGRICSAS